MNRQWNVVCTGRTKVHFNRQIVIENICRALNTTRGSANALLQGNKTVLKEGLSREEASIAQHKLDDMGLDVRVERARSGAKSASLKAKPKAIIKKVCPNCGNVQISLNICDYCETPMVVKKEFVTEPVTSKQSQPSAGKQAQAETAASELTAEKSKIAGAATAKVSNKPANKAAPRASKPTMADSAVDKDLEVNESQAKKAKQRKLKLPKMALPKNKHSTSEAPAEQAATTPTFSSQPTYVVESRWHKLVKIKAGLVLVCALAASGWWGYDYLGHYQVAAQTGLAKKQIKAQQSALARQVASQDDLTPLLQGQKYSVLDAHFNDLSQKLSQDIQWERALTQSIDVLANINTAQHELDNWVTQAPSPYAHLVRGVYYAQLGQLSAKSQADGQLTAAQAKARDAHFNLAYQDLTQAKQMAPSLLPVYDWLIVINKGTALLNPRKTYLLEAIAINPAGYQYRENYMTALQPEQGGSLEKMRAFAEETQGFVKHNPRLYLLAGAAAAWQGNQAYLNGQDGKCITHYSEALQFGLDDEWLRKRAYCLAEKSEFEKALADAEQSLQMQDHPLAQKVKRLAQNQMAANVSG
ncbi:hypothetical protein D1Z90_17475 [Motilimonas pumila]|uniref:Tetratricopeptide repeat protein n=1 Tax=Motilimonas pumila TaxID=2303987 RepID=A0A418YAQ1_9GAMM|nr:hypothetical protein D1Z90_17475 [Motilimonas pumila]